MEILAVLRRIWLYGTSTACSTLRDVRALTMLCEEADMMVQVKNKRTGKKKKLENLK